MFGGRNPARMKPIYENLLLFAVGFLGYASVAVDARLLQEDAPLLIFKIPDSTTSDSSISYDAEIKAELEEVLEAGDDHVSGERERAPNNRGELVRSTERLVCARSTRECYLTSSLIAVAAERSR